MKEEEQPWLYRILYDAALKRVYPAKEISIPTFKEVCGEKVKAKKGDWFPIAKDMEKMNMVKIQPGKQGISLELDRLV